MVTWYSHAPCTILTCDVYLVLSCTILACDVYLVRPKKHRAQKSIVLQAFNCLWPLLEVLDILPVLLCVLWGIPLCCDDQYTCIIMCTMRCPMVLWWPIYLYYCVFYEVSHGVVMTNIPVLLFVISGVPWCCDDQYNCIIICTMRCPVVLWWPIYLYYYL